MTPNEMSQREYETHEKAHERTVEDYLTILHERPDVSFGEYDNINLLMDMARDGLIEWRSDKPNKLTSMFTSLWPALTDAGRAAYEITEHQPS
jgi:hypothetical protein